ncbi:ATP-binding protein [Kitasatospora purpeofusca]|uniref:ATP-binding protein n=1 Tax=Kitasatospora purpeofusca TaxID=67352 RepID=UPI0035D65D78
MTTIAEPPVQALPDAEPPGKVTAAFPYKEESAGLARRKVRDTLRHWGLADLIDIAVLVTSELMTNAIQTGCQRAITLTIERTAEFAVRISVRDGSSYPPVFIDSGLPTDPERVPLRGRGLLLVNRLAQRWGLDLEARGKTVYADLRLGQRPRSR